VRLFYTFCTSLRKPRPGLAWMQFWWLFGGEKEKTFAQPPEGIEPWARLSIWEILKKRNSWIIASVKHTWEQAARQKKTRWDKNYQKESENVSAATRPTLPSDEGGGGWRGVRKADCKRKQPYRWRRETRGVQKSWRPWIKKPEKLGKRPTENGRKVKGVYGE